MRKNDGSGTIYRRGAVWWVKVHVDGKPVYQSSNSTKRSDAIKLRDKLLGKRERGESIGGSPDRILIGELLDDVLKSDIKDSTRYIWQKVVENSIRPFFGEVRAGRLSTDQMDNLGGHLKTGHRRTLQNRPTERNQNKIIYTLREGAQANIFVRLGLAGLY